MLNLTQFPIITLTKTINVLVPANSPAGTRIFFEYDQEINQSIIRGINVNYADKGVGTTINNTNVIVEDDTTCVYINLLNSNENKIVDELPLNALTSIANSYNRAIRRFNSKIDSAKSYIRLNTQFTSNDNIDNIIPITFYYKPLNWK